MINADGSWKAVLESDHGVEKEQTEPRESTLPLNIVPDVLDLTNEDNLDLMDTCEIADRKLFEDPVPSQFVTSNSTSLGVNFTGVDQNVDIQRDEPWTALDRAPDTQIVGVPEHLVLPVTVSPASNQEAEGHNNNLNMNYAMRNLISAPNNIQPQLNYINSVVTEYGRSSSALRHINRIPLAVQAFPVQSQALPAVPNRIPRQNSVTNLSSLQTSSSSVAPHVSLSNPASSTILSDIERQQHFTRPSQNPPQVPGVSSSTPTLQHQSETQV